MPGARNMCCTISSKGRLYKVPDFLKYGVYLNAMNLAIGRYTGSLFLVT